MIEDDGIGMAASDDRRADGLGMRTMRYRAERAGGTLTVGPGRAGGTVVRALVPRRAAEVVVKESCPPSAVRRSVAEDPASRARAADADI
jgi:signal transduction histidine kinase